MSRKQPYPTPVRMPDYLRDWMQEKADYYRRSLSAEIVFQLEELYRAEQIEGQKKEGANSARTASSEA